jgi:hypothetical protein
MVEFAGLNPMGNKPRAGCPVKNIQQTLDQLTNAGLTVAVYEEISVEIDQSQSKKVTPASLWKLSQSGQDQATGAVADRLASVTNLHLRSSALRLS